MVSDWLELDAADSWVRHDSEIVSVRHRRQCLDPAREKWGKGFPQQLEPSTWLSVTFTRPCNRSCPMRRIWTCKRPYFHRLAIAIRLRPTGAPSTPASRGPLTCNFPSVFPSMTPPSSRQPPPRARRPAFRVTMHPLRPYLPPCHRRRFAHRGPGPRRRQRHQRPS